MKKWRKDGGDILWFVTEKECSLALTLDCGQSFRFAPVGENTFEGIAHGRILKMRQEPEAIRFFGMDEAEFSSVFAPYFDIDTDYAELKAAFSADETLSKAIACTEGIRVLKQDGFETLISFLISQNNNIPRIKKIIRALCDAYGENDGFPTAEALADAGVDNLFALRTGFRAKYIHDAACRVASGEINLDEILSCDDYNVCDAKLRTIRGVGPKVSACVLLYGFGKTEAFPVDVWIKKSLERHFPDGFDVKSLGKYAGIAQQYLFYYERYING